MKKYREYLLVLLISIVVSFLVFGNSIKGDFLSDDVAYIQARADLKNSNQLLELFISPYVFRQPQLGLYRPFTSATYMLNYFFGNSPTSFHVTNILLHALTAFMVYLLIKYLTGSRKVAIFTFLLFLVHPIHTEALAPIVGRAEILATLGSLVAIYLFIKKNFLLSLIAFAFAILSKETAFTTIPLIFYIEWLREKKFPKINKYFLFLIPIILYLTLRFAALGKYIFYTTPITKAENPLAFVFPVERFFTALKILYLYVEKLILPVQLSNDYSYNAIKLVNNPFLSIQTLLGAVILIALLIILLYKKTRHSFYALGAALFVFPYVLISNLALPIGTIMGERLIYFSSVGICLILSLILVEISSHKKFWKKVAYIILILILIFYTIRTYTRNNDLLNNDTLYRSSLKQHPDAFLTRLYWGSRYMQINRWNDAKHELETAYKIYPDNPALLCSLGLYEENSGNFLKAEQYYKKAIALNSNFIEAYFDLGVFYYLQQKHQLASENLLKAIKLYPNPLFFSYYVQAEINLNRPEKAIKVGKKYFGENPKDPVVVFDLGVAYFENKDYAIALDYLEKAKYMGHKNDTLETLITLSKEKINQ